MVVGCLKVALSSSKKIGSELELKLMINGKQCGVKTVFVTGLSSMYPAQRRRTSFQTGFA